MTAAADKKALVALSGGVDSAVCVRLLQQQGYETAGLVLRMSDAHGGTVADARRAAKELDIPLYVQDMGALFQEKVVDYFAEEYRRGRTPNPCLVCNPTVKFSALLEMADKEGFGWIATGHYAGLRREGATALLTRGASAARDQSYMLARLKQDVLSRLLLPLSGLDKPAVRAEAEKLGLFCAQKPDSQEICFIPDNDYAGYIEAHYGGCPPGEFISPEGLPCGRHGGLHRYTVGQRKKLGIALGRPVFIKRIDPVQNRIYLADAGQDLVKEIMAVGLSETFPGSLSAERAAGVKIRSRSPVVPCRLYPQDGRARVVFDEAQRLPAPGQQAVFYADDVVLGGGFIL